MQDRSWENPKGSSLGQLAGLAETESQNKEGLRPDPLIICLDAL